MRNEDKLIKVAHYNTKLNSVLGFDYSAFTIYRSKGLLTHLIKRKHFVAAKYIDRLDDIISHPDYACREYSVYTKKKRQRRLSINSLSIIYSYMDYKRLGRNSHFEREEMQGYSDAFIDLDKVPIVINGKKL